MMIATAKPTRLAARIIQRLIGDGPDSDVGRDPVLFARRLGFEPDPWQANVLLNDAPQTLLNVTRQGGKSTVFALKTLHKALFQPGILILLLSPSLRQSSELFRKVLDFWRARDWYADSETKLSLELPNGSRIASLPGTEKTIRGFSGVGLLNIDEAARVPDDLYYAVRPMLAVSQGQIAAMSTPWGKRGFFYDEWSGSEVWERVEVPATLCPRISPAFLESERRTMPVWRFNQEYMCQFEDAETQAFSYEDVMAATKESVDAWTL